MELRAKQCIDINGSPIIICTVGRFDNKLNRGGIVVACIESWIAFLGKKLRKFEINQVEKIIPGGKSGHESIYKRLCDAEEYARSKSVSNEETIVLIHDGVRPLITEETITDNIKKVEEVGSCITCIPATETLIVKQADDALEIPSRADSFIARAPQSFRLVDIITAHRRSLAEGKADFIDSCTMMGHYGYKLGTIIGPMENIKITTPTDFFVLRAMVKVHEDQQIFGL